MKRLFFLSTLLLGSIGLQAACSHAQTPAKNTVAQPAVTVPESLCPGANQLISLIASKAIYAQSPEEFFKSSAEFMKPAQDKTTPDTWTRRAIVFGAADGNWLVSGNSTYVVEEKTTRFEEAIFNFAPSCFKSQNDFIKQAKTKIGKGYRDSTYPPPNDAIKVFNWSWSDTNINYIRRMQVSVSGTGYEIKIKIDPAPEEG